MRILVLGASGGTGRELVRLSLDRGHHVTALVRDPQRLPVEHEFLTVVTGDLLERGAADEAFADQDAVVSALGVHSRTGDVRVYSEGMRDALSSMHRHGIPRIVCLSAAGVGRSASPAVPKLFRALVIPLLAGREYEDMARMESLLELSGVDYTVLKPLWLRRGPARGGYRIEPIPFQPRGWGIRRADLAAAMIDLVEKPAFSRSCVWIAY